MEGQNPYLDELIDPSFSEENRPFVLSFEVNVVRNEQKSYFLPTVEIKDYNVIIDVKKINFIGNLDRAEVATMFFIVEEAKQTILDFSQGTVRVP